MAALQYIIVRQPESAGEKLTLAVRHPIDVRVLRVPCYKATLHEICFNGFNRADYARIIRWEEADQRHHEETGVEVFRAVILHKRIEARIEALPAYLFVDGGPKRLPSRDISRDPALLCGPDSAIDGDPCHHLGVNEMPAQAAHFPNAIIGALSCGLKKFNQRLCNVFAFVLRRFEPCLVTLKKSIDHLSENIY